MNDRLYELINDAFIGTTDGQLSTLNTVQNIEKLIELIVRECMTICEDVAERNDPAIACYYDIKNHFGVE